MRGTYRLRRCRKEVQCTEKSYHTIRKGDWYLYAACPPEHEYGRDDGKWWIIRACLRCVNEFGMHNSDTRKQLEAIEAKAT